MSRMSAGYTPSNNVKAIKGAKTVFSRKLISLKDFKASTDFWKSYSNPFEPLIKKGYDTYLKTNKQTEGINSYNQVIGLLINYLKTSEPGS